MEYNVMAKREIRGWEWIRNWNLLRQCFERYKAAMKELNVKFKFFIGS